jgi:dTDP-4-dehydrorhamnose 3,5-epimerase
MKFEETSLPGVVRVTPRVITDERGYFMESWHARTFAEHGIDSHFLQDNASRSVRGTLRGLHYQIQQPQGKLVRVVQGEAFDVAVDLRRSSPNYGQWVGEVLSDENKNQLWVPPGFAHGFLVLSETAEIAYKCSDYYVPELERSIRWDDPDIAIEWPLSVGTRPILSEKDAAAYSLKDAEVYE